ncbi:MAG: histone deacetylase [Calditrichaceae bacterium]|jgi:acetoin utilization deacetylase AcuC-like enzyme
MWWNLKREYIKILFSSDYVMSAPCIGCDRLLNLLKYSNIKDLLIKEKILKYKNILRPELCSYDDLRLVHTDAYLKKLSDNQYVGEILKLDLSFMLFDSIMEYYRAVTGGTLLATAYSLKWNMPCFNLGGGFHHAHPDKGEGFCLVNDVAVAIEKFRKLRRAKKFMIIDLDFHQGNGNLLYFKDNPDVFTFSMHGDEWVSIERNQNRDILLPDKCTDEEYLRILQKELNEILNNFEPDIVFYIAGSDPYEKDTIGDMNISRDGMLERNLYVYRKVRENRIPLVVLAGGGYGPDSWEIYYDFIAYCLRNKN